MKSTARREVKIADLLNEVQLTEMERWEARGAAARAEAFVDFVVAVIQGVRSTAH